MRPISLACGFHTVTPLYPTARPALLEHHKLASTSQRVVRPTLHPINHEIGEELLIGELVVRPNIDDVYMLPLPPRPVSPGPVPVLIT